jgi:hypothetical protein
MARDVLTAPRQAAGVVDFGNAAKLAGHPTGAALP